MADDRAAHRDIVAQVLRDTDRDRYLATLLLKPPAREAVQALYAFAADVASVRDRVSEPAPGEVRLQWWADAIADTGHGEVRRNPLAAALLDTIDRYDLPSGPLLRLVAARRFDLYDDPMPDIATFEGYAGETASVLYQLAALVLNAGNDAGAADAAGHLGVAQALVGHLRALGFNAARGAIFLPLEVFSAHGVTEAELFAGRRSERLAAAAAQLRELAEGHLARARAEIAKLPRAVRPGFAPVAVLAPTLNRLKKHGAAPLTTMQPMAEWLQLARMVAWAARNG